MFLTATRDEWMARLSPRFHLAPVRDYLEVAQDPQAWANGYLVNVPWEDGTERPTVGSPVHLSRTPPALKAYGPMKGQHTDEILLESGFSQAEIDDLRARGAFGREAAAADAAGAGA